MLASWREPWWKAVLAGFVLTLVLGAPGVWQRPVLAGAVAGFLAGRGRRGAIRGIQSTAPAWILWLLRSEEHTSELQSRENLVCRLLLEKKKKKNLTILICTKKKTNTK